MVDTMLSYLFMTVCFYFDYLCSLQAVLHLFLWNLGHRDELPFEDGMFFSWLSLFTSSCLAFISFVILDLEHRIELHIEECMFFLRPDVHFKFSCICFVCNLEHRIELPVDDCVPWFCRRCSFQAVCKMSCVCSVCNLEFWAPYSAAWQWLYVSLGCYCFPQALLNHRIELTVEESQMVILRLLHVRLVVIWLCGCIFLISYIITLIPTHLRIDMFSVLYVDIFIYCIELYFLLLWPSGAPAWAVRISLCGMPCPTFISYLAIRCYQFWGVSILFGFNRSLVAVTCLVNVQLWLLLLREFAIYFRSLYLVAI